MTYDDLVNHFHTGPRAARALSEALGRPVPRQTVNRWKLVGSIPIDQQIQFEKLTNGALRADISLETRQVLAQPVMVSA